MKKIIALFSLIISTNLSAQTNPTNIIVRDSIKLPGDSVFRALDSEASFPGGEKVWNKNVQKIVEKNIEQIINDKASFGTCDVQFIVDTDGSISNVEALTLKESFLAKLIIEAIKNGPKWIPATFEGKPVKAW